MSGMKFLFFSACALAANAGLSLHAHAGANVAHGKSIYEAKCAKCHGLTGDGNGPSAELLETKPVVFNDGKVFKDKEKLDMAPEARMAKGIREGGPSIGHSKLMQAYPDFSDQDITDILAYIKTLSQKPVSKAPAKN